MRMCIDASVRDNGMCTCAYDAMRTCAYAGVHVYTGLCAYNGACAQAGASVCKCVHAGTSARGHIQNLLCSVRIFSVIFC